MSTGTIVVIIVAILVVVAIVAGIVYETRRRRLRQRFGPEYDRLAGQTGSRKKAEAELDKTGQVLADLSVGHGRVLDHYRAASDISQRADDGAASTEELRQAMIHYRALFRDLLGTEPAERTGARPQRQS